MELPTLRLLFCQEAEKLWGEKNKCNIIFWFAKRAPQRDANAVWETMAWKSLATPGPECKFFQHFSDVTQTSQLM